MIFNANIIHDKSNNALKIQYNELDTSMKNNLVCKKNISRPIEFKKTSASQYFTNYWDVWTLFFKFYGRHIG